MQQVGDLLLGQQVIIVHPRDPSVSYRRIVTHTDPQ
jgi:hypothetical protein